MSLNSALVASYLADLLGFVPQPNLPGLKSSYLLIYGRPAFRPAFRSRDVAQPGRAQRSGRWGRWFKSSRPDHNTSNKFK